MNIFLTGATGAAGRPTLGRLVEAGHAVRAVARDSAKADAVRGAGAEPVAVDLFDAADVRDAVAGSDTIVHLATHVPELSKATRKHGWLEHNRLRTEATRNLLDAAHAHGVTRVVKESITMMYADHGADWIDESWPFVVSESPLVNGTRDGEKMVEELGAPVTGVVLRFGLFYGFDNRGTKEALRLARWHGSMVAGSRDAYMSSIHTDDVATAVLAALDVSGGTYNVVDEGPLTRGDYLDAFSAAFGLRKLRPVPRWVVRMMAGADLVRVQTASQRVSNARFREATGWVPMYRDARDGWAAIAAVEGAERRGVRG